VSCFRSGLSGRKKHQLAAVKFAPTADVAVAQLHEVNRTVELILPIAHDLGLARVDLHKRAWANQRKKGVVLSSDLSVEAILQIYMLQRSDRDLGPAFEHARDQIRLLGFHLVAKFKGNDQRPAGTIERRQETGPGQSHQPRFPCRLAKIEAKESQDLVQVSLVDQTQTVQFEKIGLELFRLDVGDPGMGDVVVRILLLLREFMAQALDLACRKA
jgi:hypothetical protein